MHPCVGGYALVGISGQYTAMTHQDWLVMAISRKSIFLVPNVRLPLRQGKTLSLLKLHEKTGNLGSLIGKIMNYKVIDALKEIRSMAAGLTCQCLTSPVSKRDKHRVASFQEVYVRLKAVLEEDGLKLELCCAVS